MRIRFLSAISAVVFSSCLVGVLPVNASPLMGVVGKLDVISPIEQVQYSRRGSREFRRCMRAKYGPRYFRGVPKAQRFNMAQSCGG